MNDPTNTINHIRKRECSACNTDTIFPGAPPQVTNPLAQHVLLNVQVIQMPMVSWLASNDTRQSFKPAAETQ